MCKLFLDVDGHVVVDNVGENYVAAIDVTAKIFHWDRSSVAVSGSGVSSVLSVRHLDLTDGLGV